MNRHATAIFATRKRTFRKHENSSATSRQLRFDEGLRRTFEWYRATQEKAKATPTAASTPASTPGSNKTLNKIGLRLAALISDVADSEATRELRQGGLSIAQRLAGLWRVVIPEEERLELFLLRPNLVQGVTLEQLLRFS